MKTLDRLRGTWVAHEWPLYLTVALLTSLLTVTSLELWQANISVPFTYSGDAIAVGSHFKTVIETGWYEFNPLLGAPYGQTYHDFPTADNLNFIWAKVLGWFIGDWAVAMNVYFLIGFPLAAATAVWLLRVCGLSKPVTLALAPLFALAPYHFYRGESHLFLASYYVVPLSLVLVVRAIQGRRLWGWRRGATGWRRWFGRGTGTVAIIALTGTAQSYYAVFFLVLLAFAGLVNLIRTHDWRRFWGAASTGALTVVVMLINMLPDMIYAWVNGPNPSGLERGHVDAEIYALKLTQLLLPSPGHRVGPLAQLRELYDNSYPLRSENPALGAIAAIGLVALFLGLAYLAGSGGRARFRGSYARGRARLFAALGGLVFVAFLFSTVGGLSTPISFLTTSLRGWNRMSIYIMILCLAAVGILLDALLRWISAKRDLAARGRGLVAAGMVVVVLGLGYYDQTPGNPGVGYADTIESFQRDRAWFVEVQEAAGDGATILQLPYQSFPEDEGRAGVLGSEVLIPYLHTQSVAWSGGGIKGRPRAEWPEPLEAFEPAEIVELAVASDMTGILVDRESLLPEERDTFEAGLTRAAGTPLESDDGRYLYYSLEAAAEQVTAEHDTAELDEVGARVVNPITLNELLTFKRGWEQNGDPVSRADDANPAIVLDNDTDAAVPATLELELAIADDAPISELTVEVTLPDGSVETVELGAEPVTVSRQLDVPVGRTSVTFRFPGLAVGEIPPLALLHRQVVDDTTARFLGR